MLFKALFYGFSRLIAILKRMHAALDIIIINVC